MPPLLRAALPAALLAAACGAQAANRAYDELLRQGEQAFDRMLIACQSAAPGMAATWQAQAPGLRRKLRKPRNWPLPKRPNCSARPAPCHTTKPARCCNWPRARCSRPCPWR